MWTGGCGTLSLAGLSNELSCACLCTAPNPDTVLKCTCLPGSSCPSIALSVSGRLTVRGADWRGRLKLMIKHPLPATRAGTCATGHWLTNRPGAGRRWTPRKSRCGAWWSWRSALQRPTRGADDRAARALLGLNAGEEARNTRQTTTPELPNADAADRSRIEVAVIASA